MTPSPSTQGGTGYPLTAAVIPGREPVLAIDFDTARFDPREVEILAGHFTALVESMCQDAGRLVGRVTMIGADERRTVLEWNRTVRDVPPARVHRMVEEWAAATPGALAVEDGRQALTYGELNRRANQLAHYLASQGVGPESVVAVCLERSVEMAVAVLAIVKAGAAYLPIDPGYPAARVTFTVTDACARIVVTQRSLRHLLPEEQSGVLLVDGDRGRFETASGENLAVVVEPEHLAYVIYTSGSTGQPKGVMVPHRGLMNLVMWHRRAYDVQPRDRATQLAAPAGSR